jgi:hypothetical protein
MHHATTTQRHQEEVAAGTTLPHQVGRARAGKRYFSKCLGVQTFVSTGRCKSTSLMLHMSQ